MLRTGLAGRTAEALVIVSHHIGSVGPPLELPPRLAGAFSKGTEGAA